ncbi:hypothetical protein BV25DRAFT_1841865 [Artomyces pyxidatus]|uniref:Uncharacterized protein n=1 Tax=Artomyces pyxidatus TaxID=48021 RepID=A0ACB8SN32_9AGAM|nr:hypothetical protein BV25DRAFT_1841865 [Artomyces pyxidatus]
MFSFAKIATIAAFAFGTFVSAVPVEERAVEARADTVINILDSLNSQVAPLAAQFTTLDASNATSAVISPIVSDISSAVQSAVSQISALPSGTTVDQTDALTSLSTVLSTILTPAGQVLSIPGISSAAIVPAFSPLGNALADLVSLVLKLVAELLSVVEATLVTLLSGLITVIDSLNLSPLLAALGL